MGLKSIKRSGLKLDDVLSRFSEWHDFWLFRKFRDLKYFLRNKIVRGHNNVRLRKFAGGNWVETDVRLFEATFELLREFVEEQVAWMECMCNSDKYDRWTRFKLRYLPNRFRQAESRELALKYLDWEINECGYTRQAETAKKVKELYLWYMDEYNKRDPWDDVIDPPGKLFNWGPILEDGCRQLLPNEGPEWDAYHASTDVASKEVDRLYEEATEKAIEVLRLRAHLWT